MFFFAGFETVSTLMSFMAYELAVNTEVQNLLREEIIETLTETGGKLTYDAIMKMKYMDMVVSGKCSAFQNWYKIISLYFFIIISVNFSSKNIGTIYYLFSFLFRNFFVFIHLIGYMVFILEN